MAKQETEPLFYVSAHLAYRYPALGLMVPIDYLNTLGRPCLEGWSLRYLTPSTDFVRCPFTDGRLNSGRLMNAGAMRAVNRSMDDILALTSLVSIALKKENDFESDQILRRLQTALVLRALPGIYLLKVFNEGGNDPIIPSVLSMTSRIAQGFVSQAIRAITSSKTIPTMSQENEAELIVESDLLIGPKEVCPTSKHHITKMLNAFDGESKETLPSTPFIPLPMEGLPKLGSLAFEMFLLLIIMANWRNLGACTRGFLWHNADQYRQLDNLAFQNLLVKLTSILLPDNSCAYTPLSMLTAILNQQISKGSSPDEAAHSQFVTCVRDALVDLNSGYNDLLAHTNPSKWSADLLVRALGSGASA